MSSNVPEKQTLEKDVEQRLSLKYDYTLLQEGRKTSLLFSIVFVGGPLAMAILFLSYTFTFAINNCSLYISIFRRKTAGINLNFLNRIHINICKGASPIHSAEN